MAEPVRLHHSERGTGTPLLILHGLYGSSSNWSRHAGWLAERYRVIVPDLRNHGGSPHDARMDYPAMAADLTLLLDECECPEAVVIGHSMGGKAAMALALTEPARVASLVVADIAPVNYGSHTAEEAAGKEARNEEHAAILDAMAAVDFDSIERRSDVDALLQPAVASNMVRQFLLMNLMRKDDGGWQWRIPVGLLREALPDIAAFPFTTQSYRGPTLFLRGEHSNYIRDAHQEAIRRHFPNAEVETIAGAGHWLHAEQADRFARALDDWLRKHLPH